MADASRSGFRKRLFEPKTQVGWLPLVEEPCLPTAAFRLYVAGPGELTPVKMEVGGCSEM